MHLLIWRMPSTRSFLRPFEPNKERISPTRFSRRDVYLIQESEERRVEEEKKARTSSTNLLKSVVTHCEGRALSNTVILFRKLIKKRSGHVYIASVCNRSAWHNSLTNNNYSCIFCQSLRYRNHVETDTEFREEEQIDFKYPPLFHITFQDIMKTILIFRSFMCDSAILKIWSFDD